MASTVLFKNKSILDYLQADHSAFPFQRSSLGSTGFTYLPLDPDFKCVIKWQNPIQSEIEFLCTKFYSRVFSHLSVPEVTYFTDAKSQDIARKFFKKSALPPLHTPVFMAHKMGNNLTTFAKSGRLSALPLEEKEKLFTAFGKVAGYDLLIANSDRFLPANFRGEIDLSHQANGGNIMIELEVPKKPLKIQSIHVIDNAPHFLHFFEYNERTVQGKDDSEESLGGCGLFGMESSNESFSSSSSLDAPILEDGDTLRKKRQEDFRYFISAEAGELKLMARQILIGIENETINFPIAKESDRTALLQSLFNGLKTAQEEIQKDALAKRADKLFREIGPSQEATTTLIQFIQSNLELAKNKT